MLALLLILVLWAAITVPLTFFTMHETGYALSLLVHHAVHIPFLAALVVNYLLGWVLIWADAVIWALRVSGVM